MSNFQNVNKVDVIKPRGSYQDLSHDVKLTTEFGRITPVSTFLLAPGERIRMKSDFFARVQPMFAPLMDKIDILSWTFAVPYRLLWADWENFVVGGTNGDLTGTLYEQPTVNINLASDTYTNRAGEVVENVGYKNLWCAGSLADYLDYPVPVVPSGEESTFPDRLKDIGPNDKILAYKFRAYHKIWNDYFRNQNLEPEEWDYIDGGNHDLSPVYARLRYKNFNKDYFTSALPNPQLGNPSYIPMEVDIEFVNPTTASKAAVTNNLGQNNVDLVKPLDIDDSSTDVHVDWAGNDPLSIPKNGTRTANMKVRNSDSASLNVSIDNSKNLRGINTVVTINNLRQAIAIQEFQELNARAGHRYIEYILANYGQYSRDARLQRAEYLGGHLTPVNVSAVLQQSAPTEYSSGVLGSYAGYAQAVGDVPGMEFYTADEYVIIMQLMCVVPHNSYFQGLSKHMDQQNRFDYPIPLLSGLGEQPILNKELLFDQVNADRLQYNKGTFGYTARYNEYRFLPDTIHGDFRQSLNYWHLARLFNVDDRPELNADFIKIDPDDYNRIFNVTSSDFDHFLIEVYQTIDSFRCIPRLGTPRLSANPHNMIV